MSTTTNASSSRLHPGEDGRHVTFCRLCEAFCGLEVDVHGGRITKVIPDRANPHSQGHVCIKGTAALGLIYDEDRITVPMRRTGGPGVFEPVSWDEAMTDIAQRLASVMREGGADAVANYIGNPAAFNIGAQFSVRPFLEHFGIWKLFSSATQDATSRMTASHILYGSTYRLAIPDLPRCDFLLIFGANPLVSHGSVLTAPRIIDDLTAIARRGRVVVVDPRRTETAERFEHLPIRPDTDVWLLMAMINTLLERSSGHHAAEQMTSGLERLREAIQPFTAAVAETFCGIPSGQIRKLALEFASAPRAAAYGRVGLCRGRYSTLANVLLDALNVVAGKFGVHGGWVFGDTAIDLPSLRLSGFEMRETRFGKQPYVSGNLHFSMLTDEILMPGPGRVRALLMEAGNMVLSAPGGEQLERALQSLDLFVSHDLYMNETNRFAHYLLPGTTFFEREDFPILGLGHMVRPFMQYTDASVPPVGKSRNENEVFNELSSRLHELLGQNPGASGYTAAAAPVFKPMHTVDQLLARSAASVATSEGARELNVDLLKSEPHGVVLADALICTNSLEKIKHADGRIHLWDALLDEEIERVRVAAPPQADELRLFSIRELRSVNSWMHNVDRLVRVQKPVLSIHPTDAARRGIGDGDCVEVVTPMAAIRVTAHVSEDVMPGAVCYPHGWSHNGSWRRANATAGANVNLLADPRVGDMLSASSLLDGILVEVRKVVPEVIPEIAAPQIGRASAAQGTADAGRLIP